MWSSRAPLCSRHDWANCQVPTISASVSAGSSGELSSSVNAWVSSSSKHFTGVEALVPRGSHPTMSYCSRPVEAK